MGSQGVRHDWATELNWDLFNACITRSKYCVFFVFVFVFFEEGLMYENILICPKLFLFFIIFYQLILTQILAYFNMLFIDQISENYSIFNGNLT